MRWKTSCSAAFPAGTDYRVFFSAELDDGPWRLDYYLPEQRIPERWAGDGERMKYAQLGSMQMRLIAFENADAATRSSRKPVREWRIDFDAGLGETGWKSSARSTIRAARFGLSYRVARLETWLSPMLSDGAGQISSEWL